MGSPSPSAIPSSIDPAVYLHSELNDTEDPKTLLPSCSNSDELEALHLQHQETVALKTKQGIVIQHRAWKTADAFRSEEDSLYETPLKKRKPLPESVAAHSHPPSSPPVCLMAFLSSPVAYPPSSSPPALAQRKRKRAPLLTDEPKRPRLGPFIIDEDEDEDNVLEVASLETTGFSNFGRNYSEVGKTDTPSNEFRFPAAYDQALLHPSDDKPDSVRIHEPATREQRTATHVRSHFHLTDTADNRTTTRIRTCSGKAFAVHCRAAGAPIPFEQLVAARSSTTPGRAKKSYYGVDIHELLDEAAPETKSAACEDALQPSVEVPVEATRKLNNNSRSLMWTEKYRAKRFTDLVGDERTHRAVLRWLKGWDPIVFPGSTRPKPKSTTPGATSEEPPHRKIMLLTGPPGLGKTTLAHVCARQAGYEVLELNASDERSRDVVRGRIRDSVGTENVKGVIVKTADGNVRKAGRPVCVVVDEVDGAVGGSGATGEGGFIKALLDLVALNQKNTSFLETHPAGTRSSKKKKRGDPFRLLRPLILICNDIYHPALRPLRSSKVAEIIHVRPPPLDKIVTRLRTVFEKEDISCDGDGVRRLCEATWGVSSRKVVYGETRGNGEGDMRGVMVVGEWIAGKLRASTPVPKLTRRWLEQHILQSLSHGGAGARGVGRGGAKEIVTRVFQEGAGFPRTGNSGIAGDFSTAAKVGVTELRKKEAMDRLRELIETSGECDRIVTDCFATYPTHDFQDDTLLSKPNAAYEWLHFHDAISTKVSTSQDWELMPYLSQSVLALHHLFASPAQQSWNTEQQTLAENDGDEPLPFSGPRADFGAFEAEKHNKSILLGLQSSLSVALQRSFRCLEDIATDLLPRLITLLTPDVKPVIVGGSGDHRGIASVRKESEREMVRRAVRVMTGVGVIYERVKVETITSSYGGWVYRMEPPLDALATFETATSTLAGGTAPVRYTIRQVLDQEYHKHLLQQSAEARQARYMAGNPQCPSSRFEDADKENQVTGPDLKRPKLTGAKRDFFGRMINESRSSACENDDAGTKDGKPRLGSGGDVNTVWVTFHEGFSNAVRKPITLEELIRGI